jgi:ubiquinone/menaquinone biosynthesis C-methylase UbiE
MSQQKTFYKAFSGSAAENYEKYFVPYIGRPLASDLIEAAAFQPGERVLDVACGTGIITRLAAERVAPSGSVDGLDMNPGMLEVAHSAVPSNVPINWYESSAESMPLADGNYDVVTCQLGLQFMEDKSAALREMNRVLSPGGRLAISVTGPTPEPFVVMDQALARHISPEISPFVNMVFSLNDTDELRSLISGAGFEDVSIRTFTRTLRLATPREFLWQYVHSTPIAGAVAQVDEERRNALEREVTEGWQPFVEGDAMTVSPRMLIATARK